MAGLAKKTIIISGASRGIGLAIGKRCAKDGANVVIAAKTAKAHPKLPGTVYTAADEIEKAGGKCLPFVADIRDPKQIEDCVAAAVKEFGGIDILVNNASAISLTDTQTTDAKRYDLMNQVNSRGTYLFSRECIPHLKRSSNAHILNLSPPLNMKPIWFKGHVAYTMAKYGMSMCVLGMSEEFKSDGIAVNALWPRTAIWTAAMAMLGGNDVRSQCRKVDIVADAAYIILTKPSEIFTGNFLVDDDVLRAAGITNLSHYAEQPGGELMNDFFLDEFLESVTLGNHGSDSTIPNVVSRNMSTKADCEVSKVVDAIRKTVEQEGDQKGSYLFQVTDDKKVFLDLADKTCEMVSEDKKAQVTMGFKDEKVFLDMFHGKLNPTSAYMTGKLTLKGDVSLAMKLQPLLSKMKK